MVSADAAARRRRVEGGRPISVRVKLTEAEFEAVALRAAAARLTPASFLAVAALRPAGMGEGEARAAVTDLAAVKRILAGAATNLNQIAAKLNSTGQVDGSLAASVDAVVRLAHRAGDSADAVVAVVGGRRR